MYEHGEGFSVSGYLFTETLLSDMFYLVIFTELNVYTSDQSVTMTAVLMNYSFLATSTLPFRMH